MADYRRDNVTSSLDNNEPSTSQRRPKSKDPNNSTTSPGANKASGIIGNKIGIDYHFFVTMSLCLNGYKTKQSNPSYDFMIRQECKGVGKFDDIIYEYRENESDEWTRLLIQVKNKKSSENKIKTSNLLTDNKNETFGLVKLIKSTKEIKNTDHCFYIMYTNACFDLEDDGWMKRWFKSSTQQISLFPSQTSDVAIFSCVDSQYKFDDERNIPIFCDNTDIVKEDWVTFLNKLVFVVDQPNSKDCKRVTEELIEYILPKCTETIRCNLLDIVDKSLYDQTQITSKEIFKLIETTKNEIQIINNNKYEDCKLKFVSNIPVYEFLSSGFTTLPILSTNPEFTLHKVSKEIMKLRQEKLAQEPDLKKYILKHVYSIKEAKDMKKTVSCNLLIITIKNSDQLDLFQNLKNDDKKYITIISNVQNASEIQNCYQIYRDEDHSFKLLTDRSKKYVLDERCVSFNGLKFSFKEIFQVNSGSLTREQVEGMKSVITEDILICFFNEEYKTLQLSFNHEDVNKTGVYIKRNLVYTAAIDESKIEKFTEEYEIDDLKKFETLCEQKPYDNIHYFIKRKNHVLWVQTNGDSKYLKQFIKKHRTNNFVITEDELCDVDANRVLISDMPGTRKSSLISNLFNTLQKESRAQIIIRLNLNDHTNSFSKKTCFSIILKKQ